MLAHNFPSMHLLLFHFFSLRRIQLNLLSSAHGLTYMNGNQSDMIHIAFLLYIYVINRKILSIRFELSRSLGIDKCARVNFMWFK